MDAEEVAVRVGIAAAGILRNREEGAPCLFSDRKIEILRVLRVRMQFAVVYEGVERIITVLIHAVQLVGIHVGAFDRLADTVDIRVDILTVEQICQAFLAAGHILIQRRIAVHQYRLDDSLSRTAPVSGPVVPDAVAGGIGRRPEP